MYGGAEKNNPLIEYGFHCSFNIVNEFSTKLQEVGATISGDIASTQKHETHARELGPDHSGPSNPPSSDRVTWFLRTPLYTRDDRYSV